MTDYSYLVGKRIVTEGGEVFDIKAVGCPHGSGRICSENPLSAAFVEGGGTVYCIDAGVVADIVIVLEHPEVDYRQVLIGDRLRVKENKPFTVAGVKLHGDRLVPMVLVAGTHDSHWIPLAHCSRVDRR